VVVGWLGCRPREKLHGVSARFGFVLAQETVFLGEDLLAWLVLAIGGALAVGTVLALVRPRPDGKEGELERPPLPRSIVMIVVGTVAAVWGLASILR
jgi:hypothetical protein